MIVTPLRIDYGTVAVGQTNSQLFQVINTAVTSLTGTVTVQNDVTAVLMT